MPAAASDSVAARTLSSHPMTSSPPLGRDLLATLGDERDLLRSHIERDLDDLVDDGHLEIEPARDRLTEDVDVAVLDMTPVLAQMHGDLVGAPELREHGGSHRIRFPSATGLSHSRDVVDVDSEEYHEDRNRPGRRCRQMTRPTARVPRLERTLENRARRADSARNWGAV